MMAPYLVRLLCLCGAAFFVVHSLVGLLVAALAPMAVRAGLRMRARRAAALLLALRLAPATLGLVVVAGLCVPSYLMLEEASVEEVGWLCLVLAVLAGLVWSVAIARSLRAGARSVRHARDWERVGSLAEIHGARDLVCVVDSSTPLLALAGVVHPRLVMSRTVAGALTAEQLRAALLHEEAHRTAHDNLKRLLLLLSPGLLPGCYGFHALERGWYRFTEWAADDEAVAGNPRLSLSLAAALVRIARLGGTPSPAPLTATFLADGRDLTARVDRLLAPAIQTPTGRGLPIIAVAAAIAALLAATVNAGTLESAHRLMEYLVR
ncbi:MAG: peptidase BlaR1 [Candidatus Solibacter sp.]|jgi:beta-lactamase regulating signal transducer with metallopeptidase domain|nr:peptidase BlaR1 [Candidatus Solibacter sp.]